MSKINDCINNVKTNWNEEKTAKLMRILSFFIGLFFNIIGIICIAIWKYVFCNNSEKTKHCVKIAFIGWATSVIFFLKFFFSDPFNFIEKKMIKKSVKFPTQIEKKYIDDFFDQEFEEFNQSFKRQRKIFDSLFSTEKELSNEIKRDLENQKDNDKKVILIDKDPVNKTTKKIIEDKNGYRTTIIEQNGPVSSYKTVITEYVGNNNNHIENKKANKQIKNNKNTKKNKNSKKNK